MGGGVDCARTLLSLFHRKAWTWSQRMEEVWLLFVASPTSGATITVVHSTRSRTAGELAASRARRRSISASRNSNELLDKASRCRGCGVADGTKVDVDEAVTCVEATVVLERFKMMSARAVEMYDAVVPRGKDLTSVSDEEVEDMTTPSTKIMAASATATQRRPGRARWLLTFGGRWLPLLVLPRVWIPLVLVVVRTRH